MKKVTFSLVLAILVILSVGCSNNEIIKQSVNYKDWCFFSNASDGNKLYRMNSDKTQMTKLNDISSEVISIVDDWIYFKSFEPKTEANKQLEGFYKIKIDGTYSQKLSEDIPFNVSIINGWIYYYSSDDSIIKIDVNGKNRTIIKNTDYKEGTLSGLKVYGDSIFYDLYVGDSINTIYKIDTNGDNCIKFLDNVYFFEKIEDSWVYYIDFVDKQNYRIKIDGTEKQLIKE